MKKFFVGVLTAMVIGSVGFFVMDVEAKRFGGRGFFRSSGVKHFSSFKSSKVVRARSPKMKVKQGKPKSIKTIGAKRKSSITGGSRGVKTKTALKTKRMRERFKQKPAPIVSNSVKKSSMTRKQRWTVIADKYRDNPIYSRARGSDKRSYRKRYDRYYGQNYEPPGYVFSTAPSYGMLDTIFLYSLLNNIGNAGAFAHNHQNDQDYRKWRAEADKLAEQNTDLRRQLTEMDAEAAKLSGTPIDPSYLPKGVEPDNALAANVRATTLPKLRVCVGSRSGAYYRVTMSVLGPNLGDMVSVSPVKTSGSNQALEFLGDGKCDAAWVQRDSYWNYIEEKNLSDLPFERISSPYEEAVYLICHANGPGKITELSKEHRVWFPKQSGAGETWKNFIGEDADYGNVRTVLNTALMAITSNEEALLKIVDVDNCMLYVAAPGATRFMETVEKMAIDRNLVMIDVNDGDLDDTIDPTGEKVYDYKEIDSTVHPNLARQNGLIFGSGDIDTLYLKADFVVGNAWKVANPELYPSVALDIVSLGDEIREAVGQ